MDTGKVRLDRRRRAGKRTVLYRRFIPELFWKFETISCPGLREDVPRMSGILLDFLAQLFYDHPQVFRVSAMIRSPNGLQQLLVADRLAQLYRKNMEDLEFLGSQMDSLSITLHHSFPKINQQTGQLDPLHRFLRAQPSPDCSYPREQFPNREWFDDVIVRAAIERSNLVVFRFAHAHDDNGSFKATANHAANLKP